MRGALLPLALAVVALAGCGGSAKHAATTSRRSGGQARPFAGTVARTIAARTARFEQVTEINAGGSPLEASELGNVSFKLPRRAHIYKQLPTGGIPGEVIVVGPVVYANTNVQAALADPSVQPWTKLDTSRLTRAERANQVDELGHSVAPAFLADGVAQPHRVGVFGQLTQYRGTVDPALLARRLPAGVRALVMQSVRTDYPSKPFGAQFWLDPQGRVRRVVVAYKTAKGTPVAIATRYPQFGGRIDVSLPPAREVKGVTPRS